MNGKELSQWHYLYQQGLWGNFREDLRAAIPATILANVNRGENQEAFKYTDFMPLLEKPEKKPQTIKQQQSITKILHQALKKKH